jgi:hypothetical protein
MTLVQSWIDSLTLLKPKNAQLFIMVTLKSIIEAYKLMFKYWWWAIVLMVGCDIAPLFFPALAPAFIEGSWRGEMVDASRWLYQLLFFATCVATRPSVMKKDCAYFRSQMYAFLYIIIFLALMPKLFWPTALSPLYIFLVLFFLDSPKAPKNFFLSMWYALKMIIFNYPLLAIMGIVFYVPVWLYYSSPIWLAPLAKNVLAALLLPIGVCTYANIYIKKLHDQFDLYFPQAQ